MQNPSFTQTFIGAIVVAVIAGVIVLQKGWFEKEYPPVSGKQAASDKAPERSPSQESPAKKESPKVALAPPGAQEGAGLDPQLPRASPRRSRT